MKPALRTGLVTFAIAAIAAAPAAFADEAGVTDLSGANPSAIEATDIVEALAVPRGTKIRPSARPTARIPVYFEFNSATLKPEAREMLGRVSVALETEDLEAFQFSIEGHTDSIGSESFNDDLSAARARAVRAFLAGEGVDDSRLKSVGRGESHPVASNTDDAGRQRNRRVEIVNMGATP